MKNLERNADGVQIALFVKVRKREEKKTNSARAEGISPAKIIKATGRMIQNPESKQDKS